MDTQHTKTVMVFGVFDLFHPGHKNFLEQAKQLGSKLIVVVARDQTSTKLKNRTPINNQDKRIACLKKFTFIDQVVLGDEELGAYAVIMRYKPDLIALGYDQQGLGLHLEDVIKAGALPSIKCVYLKPFFPEKYQTSRIRNLRSL